MKYPSSFVILFAQLLSLHYAIEFKDCGSETGTIISFNASPCPSEPCPLKKGSNATVQLTFNSKVNSNSVSTYIYGILGGAKVPFPGVSKDSCVNNIKCPVTSGSNATYSNYVYVNKSYPNVKVVIQLELKDDNNKLLSCVVFPAEIVD